MSTVCIIRHREYEELSLRREAEALVEGGHEVHVICLRDISGPTARRRDGIVVHELPLVRRRESKLRYLADYLAFYVAAMVLVTVLRVRDDVDIVQVNTMPDALVFCTLPAKLLGAKVIAFMKEPTPELGAEKLGRGWWTRLLVAVEQAAIRYADLSLTVTEDLKQAYVARGADPRRIRVILNGPGSSQFPEPVRHDTVTDGEGAAGEDVGPSFNLLCHGAVEDRYGHETILRAVALARSRVPGLCCRITGEGERVELLKRLAGELGVEGQVQFLGWLALEDLAAELRRADLGIVAQRSSPYSNLVHTNKMYEYMLFDVPVLATRLRSVAAYFPDTCIEYVRADDAEAMAAAIIDLFERPERRRELARNARERCEVLGWDHQSGLLLEAHQEVLAS